MYLLINTHAELFIEEDQLCVCPLLEQRKQSTITIGLVSLPIFSFPGARLPDHTYIRAYAYIWAYLICVISTYLR